MATPTAPLRTNRLIVRAAVCPECNAMPFQKCMGVHRPRTACHSSRWQAYRDMVTLKTEGPKQ